MKKAMIKNIFVLTLVAVLMGALIGGTYLITNPIIKRNRDIKLIQLAETQYPEGKEFHRIDMIPKSYLKGELTSKEKAELTDYLFIFGDEGEYVGLIVTGSGSNGYGDITIGVSINKGDLIQNISAIEFAQTPGIGINAWNEYEAKFENVELDFKLDAVAGATITSNTLADIISAITTKYSANKPILEKILNFEEIVIDPVEAFFGTITEANDDSLVANEVVLERNIVTGTKASGYSYVAEKTYSFESPAGTVSGNTKIKLYTDDNGVIKHYEFIEYSHSKDTYQEKVINYFNAFIDTNINEVETTISDNTELKAGVTQTTTNVIDIVLLAIKEAHKSTHPLYKVFGEFSKEVDSTFTANEVVLEKHIITGELKSGVSYIGNKEHQFEAYGTIIEGNVKIELFIDEDGIIVHYEYLEYKHSEGFKNPIDNFLNAFIGTKAENITDTIAANKAIYAGSTETAANVITPILLAIETEVNK